MPDKDRRIDLILAYTEAGLLDKAEELKREMVAERLGRKPKDMGTLKDEIKAAGAKLDAAMAKLRDKLTGEATPAEPPLDKAAVEALLKSTRSRTVQYLCRAWIQFGEDVMPRDKLAELRAAVAKRSTK